MESKRIGGALLTAFSTGAGIMVPYTFKTMSPPIMAVIWAALVFSGIVGLVLALKPEGTTPTAAPSATPPRAHREPLIDPDVKSVILGVLTMPAIMIGFLLFLGIILAAFRGLAWLLGAEG